MQCASSTATRPGAARATSASRSGLDSCSGVMNRNRACPSAPRPGPRPAGSGVCAELTRTARSRGSAPLAERRQLVLLQRQQRRDDHRRAASGQSRGPGRRRTCRRRWAARPSRRGRAARPASRSAGRPAGISSRSAGGPRDAAAGSGGEGSRARSSQAGTPANARSARDRLPGRKRRPAERSAVVPARRLEESVTPVATSAGDATNRRLRHADRAADPAVHHPGWPGHPRQGPGHRRPHRGRAWASNIWR